MRAAFAVLILAGCATGAVERPSRRAVSAAIINWSACVQDETTSCLPPPRRVELTRLSCIPAPEPGHPERMLCRFSGARIMGVRHRLRFSGECAHLVRYSPRGRWSIQNFPDADLCDFRE